MYFCAACFVLNFRTVATVGSSVRMVMTPCRVRFTKYTHNAGISGSAVFQPRSWYASTLDRAV